MHQGFKIAQLADDGALLAMDDFLKARFRIGAELARVLVRGNQRGQQQRSKDKPGQLNFAQGGFE